MTTRDFLAAASHMATVAGEQKYIPPLVAAVTAVIDLPDAPDPAWNSLYRMGYETAMRASKDAVEAALGDLE